MGRDRARVGGSTDVLSSYFNRTDTTCRQIKIGMVAYLGGDHHTINKIDTTCQQVNLGMVAYLGAVYDHSISSGHPSTATHNKSYD